MTFRLKLVLLLLLVAVVPVALSGALSIYTSQGEMTARIEAFQEKNASLVAEAMDGYLQDAVVSLKLATQFIPFDQIPHENLPDVLKIPYRQFDFINIVALLDKEGKQMAEPVFETNPSQIEAIKRHESVSVEEVETFGRHIPFKAALVTGATFGPVYLSDRNRMSRVAIAIAFPARQKKERWVLAAELSLRKIREKVLGSVQREAGLAFVVDGEGRPVVHPNWAVLKRREPMMELPIVSVGLRSQQAQSLRYSHPGGRRMAGAFAPLRTLGWGLVIEQPVEQAFAAVRRMRFYAMFWVTLSLAVAVFGGILFGRGVSQPIRELSMGAERIAQGSFDLQIPVRSRDEIGHLAGAFNQMAASLRKSFDTILDQNREIQAKSLEIDRWNQELQRRVEEGTQELKEAHAQILRSQKLAAVAELGAGVAHEINNPLTGVRGYAELMRSGLESEHPFHRHLTAIIVETNRIQSIVADLLLISQNPQGGNRGAFDLNATVFGALRMVEGRLREQHISIEKKLAADSPRVYGNSSDIQQVFLHLIDNAKNAMPEGGVLTLETAEIEGEAARISIRDTGKGIPLENLSKIFDPFFTTKDVMSGRGMGLAVSNRIVEEHHGKITVQSEVGEGTTFTVFLPGVRRELHLV